MKQPTRVLSHPVAGDALSTLRNVQTQPPAFRAALHRLSLLLAAAALRDLPSTRVTIQTPLVALQAPVLAGKLPCLVPVLRAGLGLVAGFHALLPEAPVAHFGAWRDHQSLQPLEYYFRAPPDMAERAAIVLDPMLATGGTATAAVARVKASGATTVTIAAILAAPEGLAALAAAHPDVLVVVAAIDERLDERGYIVPGLGDAGDRMFATA